MRYVLYFDSETTGLSPERDSMHQVGCIVEADGQVVDKFSIRMRPMTDSWSQEALDKCGVTIEQLRSQQPHQEAYVQFKDRLLKHLPKGEKYHVVMYNSAFDSPFLVNWMKANGDWFGKFMWHPFICSMVLAGEALWELRSGMKSFKLTSVVDTFEEMLRPGEPRMFDPEKNHDAVYDALMC